MYCMKRSVGVGWSHNASVTHATYRATRLCHPDALPGHPWHPCSQRSVSLRLDVLSDARKTQHILNCNGSEEGHLHSTTLWYRGVLAIRGNG
jgi:hypothetical protein